MGRQQKNDWRALRARQLSHALVHAEMNIVPDTEEV
jgi:hypothetical protein